MGVWSLPRVPEATIAARSDLDPLYTDGKRLADRSS
jgi:hypothetical protein